MNLTPFLTLEMIREVQSTPVSPVSTQHVSVQTTTPFQSTPLCPRCGGIMTHRVNKTTNVPFWGCANFPKCGGTLEVKN